MTTESKDIPLMYENMLAAFAADNGDNMTFNEFLCDTLAEKHNREAAARLLCVVLGDLGDDAIKGAASEFRRIVGGDLERDLENVGEWWEE